MTLLWVKLQSRPLFVLIFGATNYHWRDWIFPCSVVEAFAVLTATVVSFCRRSLALASTTPSTQGSDLWRRERIFPVSYPRLREQTRWLPNSSLETLL